MGVYQRPRYHEWRWKTHVEPLLEKDGRDRTLLDLGCNAGFYMKKANRLGYRTFGVEMDDEYIAQAPKSLNITKADINLYTPRSAYLTLLLLVHHHQTEEQCEAIFHKLMYSTATLMVMGRHTVYRKLTKLNPNKESLMPKLRGWDIIDSRDSDRFYSILLNNPRYVREFNVDDLYFATREFVSKVKGYVDFVPSFEDFTRRTLEDIGFDPSESDFAKHLKARGLRYVLGRCWQYKVMIDDIRKNGLSTALIVRDGHMRDGFHRLVVLRELGVKRVVCRIR